MKTSNRTAVAVLAEIALDETREDHFRIQAASVLVAHGMGAIPLPEPEEKIKSSDIE